MKGIETPEKELKKLKKRKQAVEDAEEELVLAEAERRQSCYGNCQEKGATSSEHLRQGREHERDKEKEAR